MKSLLYDKAQEIIARAQKINVTLATAESCTGGMVSAILTEIPGASAVFDRGFITYSNQSKSQMLGVADETIKNMALSVRKPHVKWPSAS